MLPQGHEGTGLCAHLCVASWAEKLRGVGRTPDSLLGHMLIYHQKSSKLQNGTDWRCCYLNVARGGTVTSQEARSLPWTVMCETEPGE